MRLSSPDVLLKIFPDAIAVDKRAAVYYLSVVLKYPFDHEVKGLTRAYVDSVIKAATEEDIAITPSSDTQNRKIVHIPHQISKREGLFFFIGTK